MKKKKKKHIRFKGVIFLLLLVYLVGMFVYYIFTLPVKNIVINGNILLTEKEIIDSGKVKIGMSMFKKSSKSIKNGIKNNPMVDTADVKKHLNGRIDISITEAKPLFLYSYTNKVVLSNNKTIEDNIYVGYPLLVNYVPSEIYNNFIKGLSKISSDIIGMISEIEYSPDKYEDVVLDNERFLLRMNDGNKVYINIINIEKIGKYQNILATVGTGGTLYLDSSSKNYIFEKDK